MVGFSKYCKLCHKRTARTRRQTCVICAQRSRLEEYFALKLRLIKNTPSKSIGTQVQRLAYFNYHKDITFRVFDIISTFENTKKVVNFLGLSNILELHNCNNIQLLKIRAMLTVATSFKIHNPSNPSDLYKTGNLLKELEEDFYLQKEVPKIALELLELIGNSKNAKEWKKLLC